MFHGDMVAGGFDEAFVFAFAKVLTASADGAVRLTHYVLLTFDTKAASV